MAETELKNQLPQCETPHTRRDITGLNVGCHAQKVQDKKIQRPEILRELAQDLTNIVSLPPPTTVLGRGLREYCCYALEITPPSWNNIEKGQLLQEQKALDQNILRRIKESLEELTGESLLEQETLDHGAEARDKGEKASDKSGVTSSSQASSAFDDLADFLLDKPDS